MVGRREPSVPGDAGPDNLAQEFEALTDKVGCLDRQASDVAARSRQTVNESTGNRIRRQREHDGDCRRCLSRSDDIPLPMGNDHIGLEPNELRDDLVSPITVSFTPANSIAIVLPSIQPTSRNRFTKAAVHAPAAE
jgi:hypothetical protein